MDNSDMEIRQGILHYSLVIEGLVANFVGRLLGIDEPNNSLCFGNTSQALSFNQKINLLLDINSLGKEDKKKYVAFMEVRNQFMHNIRADSYESCFSYLESTKNFVLKNYSQPEDQPLETRLRDAVIALCADVMNITLELWDKVDEVAKENKDNTENGK